MKRKLFEKILKSKFNDLQKVEFNKKNNVIIIPLDCYTNEGMNELDSIVKRIIHSKFKSELVYINNWDVADKYNYKDWNEEDIHIKIK